MGGHASELHIKGVIVKGDALQLFLTLKRLRSWTDLGADNGSKTDLRQQEKRGLLDPKIRVVHRETVELGQD